MRSGPTPELTRREEAASCGKFSMKDLLIPVGLNELLGRACDVSIQPAIWLCSAASITITSTEDVCEAAQRILDRHWRYFTS
jgi:hypothetical protein